MKIHNRSAIFYEYSFSVPCVPSPGGGTQGTEKEFQQAIQITKKGAEAPEE